MVNEERPEIIKSLVRSDFLPSSSPTPMFVSAASTVAAPFHCCRPFSLLPPLFYVADPFQTVAAPFHCCRPLSMLPPLFTVTALFQLLPPLFTVAAPFLCCRPFSTVAAPFHCCRPFSIETYDFQTVGLSM
jgi:hypothetical protein